MKRPVFQDLLDHQRVVAQVISYPIAGMYLVMLAVLYFGVGLKTTLPQAMFIYILLILLNILIFRLHKNLFANYLTIISMSYIWFIYMTCMTGGIFSPFITAFLLLPAGAFITSRKQGRIWTAISIVTFFVLFKSDIFGLPVTDILNDEESKPLFYFITALSILVISSLLAYFVKTSTYQLHLAYHSASSELSKKSQRLEMLANMLNYSSDLMCIIEAKGLVIDDLNPTFRELLGWEMEELQGKKWTQFMAQEENISSLESDVVAMKNNQTIEFDCHMICKDGNQKPFNWVGICKEGKLYASARAMKSN